MHARLFNEARVWLASMHGQPFLPPDVLVWLVWFIVLRDDAHVEENRNEQQLKDEMGVNELRKQKGVNFGNFGFKGYPITLGLHYENAQGQRCSVGRVFRATALPNK